MVISGFLPRGDAVSGPTVMFVFLVAEEACDPK